MKYDLLMKAMTCFPYVKINSVYIFLKLPAEMQKHRWCLMIPGASSIGYCDLQDECWGKEKKAV